MFCNTASRESYDTVGEVRCEYALPRYDTSISESLLLELAPTASQAFFLSLKLNLLAPKTK